MTEKNTNSAMQMHRDKIKESLLSNIKIKENTGNTKKSEEIEFLLKRL